MTNRELDTVKKVLFNISYKLYLDCYKNSLNKVRSCFYDEDMYTVKVLRILLRVEYGMDGAKGILDSVRGTARKEAFHKSGRD